MTGSSYSTRGSTARTLDQELGLVREAIAMVRSGGAPRVVLGGLRFGEQLLEAARQMAVGTGVRIVPLWTTDETGVDISVERIADAGVANG